MRCPHTSCLRCRIKLKDLNENSNIPLYAANIVDRCEFIHESQLPQVTDRLYAMQAYLVEHGRRADSAKALVRVALSWPRGLQSFGVLHTQRTNPLQEREARRRRREQRRKAQARKAKEVRVHGDS